MHLFFLKKKTNLCEIPETNDECSSCVCNPFTISHLTNVRSHSARIHFEPDTILLCEDLWGSRCCVVEMVRVMLGFTHKSSNPIILHIRFKGQCLGKRPLGGLLNREACWFFVKVDSRGSITQGRIGYTRSREKVRGEVS